MQVYATSNLQKARSAFVIKIGMVLHHWSISNACAVRPQLHEVSSLADHSPIPTVRPSWVQGTGGTGGTGLVSPVACSIAGMFLSKRSKTRLKAVVRSTRTNPEAAASNDDGIDYASDAFEVRPVWKKGLGVVATKPIKRGELLLEEAPLLVFQNQSFDVLFGDLQENLVDETSFDKWDTSLRETLKSRCNEEVFSKFWDLADSCSESVKAALGIARTNGIGLSEDSAGLFLLLSRFNHSCKPNVHNSWQEDRQVQVLRSTCDIDRGQELCISYLSLLTLCAPANERLGEISDRFGFDCMCESCSRSKGASDWRRERLSQLCDAFSREEAVEDTSDSIIWLNLRPRMPLFFEVDKEVVSDMTAQASKGRGPSSSSSSSIVDDDVVERIDMRDALRETVDLLDEEFGGNPAARALVFFGAFRRALKSRRVSAARSLAAAAWKATVAAEGPSWRARQLESFAKDARRPRTPANGDKMWQTAIWFEKAKHHSLLFPCPYVACLLYRFRLKDLRLCWGLAVRIVNTRRLLAKQLTTLVLCQNAKSEAKSCTQKMPFTSGSKMQ